MDDELQGRIGTGADAEAVLTSPAYALAFEAIELELTDAWKRSPQRDAEGRERLHLSLCLLLKVRTKLDAMIQDGNMAAKRLEEMNRPRSALERLRGSLDSWGE